MKYLIRSLKYFFYLAIILCLILAALVAFKLVEADISKMFVHGYDSLWQIALLLAAFAALYPRFGFSRRSATLPGSPEETREGVIRAMESNGYIPERQEGEKMTFRKKSVVSRAFKMWEDRITITKEISGYCLEGLTKDLPRLVAALEASGDL